MAAGILFDILETTLQFISGFADRCVNTLAYSADGPPYILLCVGRLLIHLLQTHVMTEGRVITVVKLSKRTLFPNGYPGPPPVIPSAEEQLVIKEQLIRQIQVQVPSKLPSKIMGDGRMLN